MARNFRGLAACKDFSKNFCGSTIAKLHPYWVPANHTHITRESAVMARELSVEAMVHGYHIYEDIWNATAGEEQSCQRESVIINRHQHHATA